MDYARGFIEDESNDSYRFVFDDPLRHSLHSVGDLRSSETDRKYQSMSFFYI